VSFRFPVLAALALAPLAACGGARHDPKEAAVPSPGLLDKYTTVKLTADLSALTPNERLMLPLLIEAAQAMDEIFWLQAYGDKDELLSKIEDPVVRRFAEINYGPWDRLGGNAPFIESAGPKPDGAGFYPRDMTREEFEAAVAGDPVKLARFRSQYTLIRRAAAGDLEAVGYGEAYSRQMGLAAERLREAAALAEDPGLESYLELRSDALLSDRYRESDVAWLDMKTNTLDIVIGPIETYEDQLFGYKSAAEAYVLIKDAEWSRRLARYAAFLPDLQTGLPVPDEYKREAPGTDSDLNAYDVVYYAGDCNAGSKTIAINLPNDEQVQLEKGTRRLQLKNAMRAKFDAILVPIAEMLISEDQRSHVTFDAFFENTMFHEVAHGLGIKNTISGRSTVRDALKEQASALEEGKADILGLHMIVSLQRRGEMEGEDVRDNYVTFLASVFRSTRFGAASAHGRANAARFKFFEDMGAFTRDEASGTYRVDFGRMETAMAALAEKILRLQGDGDYDGVKTFMDRTAQIGPTLAHDLDRLASAGIPVDIVFDQGVDVLGLESTAD
jgi:hypothetical protein